MVSRAKGLIGYSVIAAFFGCADNSQQTNDKFEAETNAVETSPSVAEVASEEAAKRDAIAEALEEEEIIEEALDDLLATTTAGFAPPYIFPGFGGSGGPNHRCGNRVREHVERCDEGGETAECDDDCTLVKCGDDNVNEEAGEECDDGNTTSGDGCSSTCEDEDAVCGNGVVEAGEECDEGENNSDEDPDACRENCEDPSCGDNVVDTGE